MTGRVAPDLPENARPLAAEATSDKDRELTEFAPEEGSYAFHAACVGKGEVSIVVRNGTLVPSPATESPAVGVIRVEDKPQHFEIQVTGGTPAWKIAVISGNHQP
ncbi:hypothetical protein AB0M25_03295 [Streptomyces griseomycini]|uniref:hypothetical protein n=1 Tax=Streptomyces griseomycini TaxID=66895 RepID=UPI0034224AC7